MTTTADQITITAIDDERDDDRLSLDPGALAIIQHAAQMSQLGLWAMSPDDAERLILAGPQAQHEPAATGPTRIALLPVVGPMTDRPTIFTELFGGVSYRALTATLQRLDADPSIAAVVLDVDSPGGTVAGLESVAATVAGMQTRTIAVADSMMASAAYWIGSQADEIVATPGSLVGSVGVFTTHVDTSKLLKRIGLTVTHISAGEGKTDGTPTEPLGDDARAHAQALVDETYQQFVARVVSGRARAGVTLTADQVRDDWTARVHSPDRAQALGMIDRQAASVEAVAAEVVAELASGDAAKAAAARRARQRRRLAMC